MVLLIGGGYRLSVRLGAAGSRGLAWIDAAEARIKATDGVLNAMPTLCLDRARAHAKRLMDAPPTDPAPHYLHGLPIAVGMALGLRARGLSRPRVVCLVGDAELDEGSNSEAI